MVAARDLPPRGEWDWFTVQQQVDINTWTAQLVEQAQQKSLRNRKVGLWVYGPRRSGTTTIASTAARRACADAGCGVEYPQYITAFDAAELVKSGWDETARLNPHDDAAWIEALEVEEEIEFTWDRCGLLWLDDLHLNTVPGAFVQNHLFPRLERRVKAGKPSVVATSLTLDNLGVNLPVVKDLFVMVEATRAVR